MRGSRNALVLLLLFVCCTGSALAQQPFTYQGMLKSSGVPASGNFDFQFSLWTALSGGSQIGSTLTKSSLNVQNGLFTTELDFGAVWDGNDRYLQIAVRPAGSGSYTTLSPRVKVTRVPYSQLAYSASAVPWSGIVGVPSAFPPGGPAGGDLSGTYPAPVVVGVQGRPVANVAPGAGQVLKWDGARWSPADDLRDALWQASGSDIFYAAGRVGIGTSTPNYPLHVQTDGGLALYAVSTAISGYNYGVLGVSTGTSSRGVGGHATSATGYTIGVIGTCNSPDGTGVVGLHMPTWGTTPGVHGATNSTSDEAVGILGEVSSTSPGASSAGVRGINRGTGGAGIGVWGSQDGSGFGVYGSSVSGSGVVGRATATSGSNYGGRFLSDSTSGTGVYGLATATSGETTGVFGRSNSTSGTGVYGLATATSGTNYGVFGRSNSTSGRGVYGWATTADGVTVGVYGRNDSREGAGIFGWATATVGITFGVLGESNSTSGTAVRGDATATSGNTVGVYGGSTSSSGRGVEGYASATTGTTYGVWGGARSSSGYGVYSWGNFTATGTKSFQMDHPLMPETHYLNHFCTEGPEPYNAYSGNVVTDAQGYAVVQLPDYFESINRDFRYQLTVIDSSDDFVLAKVVREIQNNRFVIRTSKPFVKVSWRVEAVRNDRWVQEYGYQTEQAKPAEHRGRYLNPELYGQPREMGIHHRLEPERDVATEKPVGR